MKIASHPGSESRAATASLHQRYPCGRRRATTSVVSDSACRAGPRYSRAKTRDGRPDDAAAHHIQLRRDLAGEFGGACLAAHIVAPRDGHQGGLDEADLALGRRTETPKMPGLDAAAAQLRERAQYGEGLVAVHVGGDDEGGADRFLQQLGVGTGLAQQLVPAV